MKNLLFRWVEGQRKTGYYILTLARFAKPFSFDCYIIKYPPGSFTPPHFDKTRRPHYRINVILTHPKGGEFVCENPMFKSKWLNFFRPDISEHSVTKVEDGTRYVFSVGWLYGKPALEPELTGK